MQEAGERDCDMEYRVLKRVNCHILQYKNLYKMQNFLFSQRNRYNEVLAFKHNLVQLKEVENQLEVVSKYVNASYINVSLTPDNSLAEQSKRRG